MVNEVISDGGYSRIADRVELFPGHRTLSFNNGNVPGTLGQICPESVDPYHMGVPWV